MELENVLWMLTALAAVVVLLTWMRMKASATRTGHAAIPQGIVTGHTLFGVVALGVWAYYLTSPSTSLGPVSLGVVSLVLWWIEVILGLLILMRWLPGAGGGLHADDAKDDSWADGPALSILGHIGMLLGIGFFTFVVLTDRVAG